MSCSLGPRFMLSQGPHYYSLAEREKWTTSRVSHGSRALESLELRSTKSKVLRMQWLLPLRFFPL